MSLHTCIYNNPGLEKLSTKDKETIYNILWNNQVNFYDEDDVLMSKVKRKIKLFYILDMINSYLDNRNKIVIDNVDKDKRLREMLLRYTKLSYELLKCKKELYKADKESGNEFNPLMYSSEGDKYYDDINLFESIMENKQYSFCIQNSFVTIYDILNNSNSIKIRNILKKLNNESEELK